VFEKIEIDSQQFNSYLKIMENFLNLLLKRFQLEMQLAGVRSLEFYGKKVPVVEAASASPQIRPEVLLYEVNLLHSIIVKAENKKKFSGEYRNF